MGSSSRRAKSRSLWNFPRNPISWPVALFTCRHTDRCQTVWQSTDSCHATKTVWSGGQGWKILLELIHLRLKVLPTTPGLHWTLTSISVTSCWSLASRPAGGALGVVFAFSFRHSEDSSVTAGLVWADWITCSTHHTCSSLPHPRPVFRLLPAVGWCQFYSFSALTVSSSCSCLLL